MTPELQKIIARVDATAQLLTLQAARATELVARMRTLARLDEWTMPQELEWAELEKQYRLLQSERTR